MVSETSNHLNNHHSFEIYQPPLVSIIVPVYNEADNLTSLIHEIHQALAQKISYEIIYVDDGSNDQSWQILQELTKHLSLKIIRHARSYGQSIAILTGVKTARAEWIVTLDGDGQNDPTDIWRLLAVLKNPARPTHLQMVAGQRCRRQDNWLRRVSSQLANHVRKRLLKDGTLDTGCGLKLFSKKAFLALPHFNHMHRFLPALFLRAGGSVVFVEVNHRPRLHGQSKYGVFNRLWVGLMDLLGVMWLQRRSCLAEIIEEPPSHE